MIKDFFSRLKALMGSFGIAASASGTVCLALYIFLMSQGRFDPATLGGIVIFAFLCSLILSLVIIHFVRERSMLEYDDESENENFTMSILAKIDTPILICRPDGSINWANRSFQGFAGSNITFLRKTPLSSIISYETDVILNADKFPDGVDGTLGGRKFKVKGFRSVDKKSGINHIILVWYDQTEINDAIEKMFSERTVVATIMLDNIDDLIQYTDGNYRDISTRVDSILMDWAASVKGFIKEYQRDRYIFLFDAKYIAEFAEDKFSILEKIREIRVGDSNTPVTISIGVSDVQGSLEERLKSSSAYLETALQRGGDQAVVKIDGTITFFGGVTKTVQRRTKIRARVMANELVSLIASSSNVIIMGHKNADYDCFGACIAVGRIAKFCEVPAKIIINAEDPNLTRCIEKAIRVPHLENIFIDKLGAQDLLKSDTLLIIVDVNNPYQFEAKEVFENAHKIAYIDHHRLAFKFEEEPDLTYIEPSASSTCELLTELLEHILPENTLTIDESELMYAGIALDTKKFTVNSGTKTFSAAMYLRANGADPMAVNKQLFGTDVTELTKLSGFENKIKVYRDITAISVNERTDLTQEDDKYAAMAADKLLTLDGVVASFTVCRIGETVRIKARSNGSLNVQLVLEKLGGGGHFDQAATVMTGATLEQACAALRLAIDAVIDNNK